MINYTLDSYRLGTIVRDKVPDCPLTIIEIDILLADGHIPRNHLWPEAVPCIDGAVICYDSADHASFKPVELLLRKLSRHLSSSVVAALSFFFKALTMP